MKKIRKGQIVSEADYCYGCPCFSFEKDDREFSGVAKCKKYGEEIMYRWPRELRLLICEDV